MKHLIRYCSVLLCFLLLFTAFSLTASAEEVEVKDFKIYQENALELWDGRRLLHSFTFDPVHESESSVDDCLVYETSSYTAAQLHSQAYFTTHYYVNYQDDSVILKGGKNYSVSLNNMYHSMLVEAQGKTYYVRDPQTVSAYGFDINGNVVYSSDIVLDHKTGNALSSVKFNLSPDKDIYTLCIYLKSSLSSGFPSYTTNYTPKLTTYLGNWGDYDMYLEVESKEEGLLKGLLGKITELWNTTKDGFSNLTNGITNVFNSILELPSKLWDLISEGLKNLFVPDEQYMSDYSNTWDELLSQRFGAIYDVASIMIDFVNDIELSDTTNTITFPQVSLNFKGVPFVFGGYDVKIVPDNFSFLADACKLIISIACTFLFVNGLRKRYDEVMGVEQ